VASFTIGQRLLHSSGKLVMESIVETKASSILQFVHGLRGELHVTWEEGTWASWLYDLLLPQVRQVLVCDPRRNALLKEGSKTKVILQNVEDGNPIRTRALHHHVRNPLRQEPFAKTGQGRYSSIEAQSSRGRFFVRRTCKDTAQKKTLTNVDSGTTLVDFAHRFTPRRRRADAREISCSTGFAHHQGIHGVSTVTVLSAGSMPPVRQRPCIGGRLIMWHLPLSVNVHSCHRFRDQG
jgi:hypothetical protein